MQQWTKSCLKKWYPDTKNYTKENEVSEEATWTKIDDENTNKDADKAVKILKCVISDLKSKWPNGLKVHMSWKHCYLEQLDGMTDTSELENDKKYKNTEHYWNTSPLGARNQHSTMNQATPILSICVWK